MAGEAWATASEEHELLTADDADHDQDSFLAGRTTPVLFASALLNFGVAQLLDVLLELAPAPAATPALDGTSARSRTTSAPSSSRCSQAWTPSTATGWPTPGCAPGSSVAGWS